MTKSGGGLDKRKNPLLEVAIDAAISEKPLVKDSSSKEEYVKAFANSVCKSLAGHNTTVFKQWDIQIVKSDDKKKQEGMLVTLSPSDLAEKINSGLVGSGVNMERKMDKILFQQKVVEAAERAIYDVCATSPKLRPILSKEEKEAEAVRHLIADYRDGKLGFKGQALEDAGLLPASETLVSSSPEELGIGSEPIVETIGSELSSTKQNKSIKELLESFSEEDKQQICSRAKEGNIAIDDLSRKQKDKLFKTLIDAAIEKVGEYARVIPAQRGDLGDETIIPGFRVGEDSRPPQENSGKKGVTSESFAEDVCKELAEYQDVFKKQGIQIATNKSEAKEKDVQVMISPSDLEKVIDKEVKSLEQDSGSKNIGARVIKAIGQALYGAYQKSGVIKEAMEMMRDRTTRSKEEVTQRRAARDLRNSLRKSDAVRGR